VLVVDVAPVERPGHTHTEGRTGGDTVSSIPLRLLLVTAVLAAYVIVSPLTRWYG
jgi:hypothetical protein